MSDSDLATAAALQIQEWGPEEKDFDFLYRQCLQIVNEGATSLEEVIETQWAFKLMENRNV